MNAHPAPFLDLLNGDVQYVIPIWQRRYCWGKDDIERLVEDLITIARSDSNSSHYGGTILTLQEPKVPGEVLQTYRVIDGQQRLTTVTVLLACIAKALGDSNTIGDWTPELIKRRITNPDLIADKFFKLKLQPGDHEAYCHLLEGEPAGSDAITQAWRILTRLVAKNSIRDLLTGLGKFEVVSIGLGESDDPQQTFESINATGRPLTESEKVKNWLLIGLPTQLQHELYNDHWCNIEKVLKAEHDSTPIDMFLKDFLRWQTGDLSGLTYLYANFRRWAVRTQKDVDRPKLCRELTQSAKLYGLMTGSFNPKNTRGEDLFDKAIRTELEFLGALNLDVHRPFTLRLLHDAIQREPVDSAQEDLQESIKAISTWLTRLALSSRGTAGLNRAFVDLANSKGPELNESTATYWIDQIKRLRNRLVGVPDDEEVRRGCKEQTAYGGSAGYATFAILCSIMRFEQGKEPISLEELTIEHIMPQKLTEEWRTHIGDEADRVHSQYRHRIGNLTLTGYNPELGAKSFDDKKKLYESSNISMTSRLAKVQSWNEEAIIQRSEDIANQAIRCWPWLDDLAYRNTVAPLRWRLGVADFRNEQHASDMVLNIIAELLELNPENVNILSGKVKTRDLQKKSEFPDFKKDYLREIPRHSDYIVYPYAGDWSATISRCKDYCERCGVQVEILSDDPDYRKKFWLFLYNKEGGVPGQTDKWIGMNQRSRKSGDNRDFVSITLGDDYIWMYVKRIRAPF